MPFTVWKIGLSVHCSSNLLFILQACVLLRLIRLNCDTKPGCVLFLINLYFFKCLSINMVIREVQSNYIIHPWHVWKEKAISFFKGICISNNIPSQRNLTYLVAFSASVKIPSGSATSFSKHRSLFLKLFEVIQLSWDILIYSGLIFLCLILGEEKFKHSKLPHTWLSGFSLGPM